MWWWNGGHRYWVAVLVPAVLAVALALSEWSDLRRFNEKAPYVQTVGTVANLDCSNHGQYQVKFTVGERTLIRDAGNSFLRGKCGYLRVGQPVSVWHSVQDPGYASFIPPEQALSYMKSEIIATVAVGYPFMAGFLLLALWLSSRKGNAA